MRAAAEQLGYTGNAVARALSQGRTGLVGVLAGSLEDLGEQRFVESVGQALEANALHMVLTDSAGDPERERHWPASWPTRWSTRLVVSPLDPSNAAWAAIGETLPVVSVGDALAGPTVGDVIFDNRAGVFMVLEHLHALGHRRVAVLTPSRPETPARPAETMVREAAATLSLDVVTVNSRHSIEAATEAARTLLAARPAAHRGLLPFGLDRLRRVRRSPRARALTPADLSVAGYDDHPIAQVVSPTLTSVAWGMTDVAEHAGRLLAAAIAGRPRRGARATVQRLAAPRLPRVDRTGLSPAF